MKSVSNICASFFYLIFTFTTFCACKDKEIIPLQSYSITTTASPTEGGKVTITPQANNYKSGEVVTINAEAQPDWVFQKWEGDISGTSNPIQVTIGANKSIVAVFVKKVIPAKYTIYNTKIENAPKNMGSVHSLYYQRNNKEFIIDGMVNWNDPTHTRLPLFRLKRGDNTWVVENIFSEVEMSEIRNSEFMNNGEGFAIGDHGPEWPNIPWPHSNLYVAKFSGDNIKWEKVSKNVSFYHDVAIGDLNDDGIFDVAGVHMGTRFNNIDNPHVYFQKSDNTYTEQIGSLPTDFFPSGCCGDVEIFDIDGDTKKELIAIGGGEGNPKTSIRVMKYNSSTQKFQIHKHIEDAVITGSPQSGSYNSIKMTNEFPVTYKGYMPTNKRFYDLNKDGKKDMIIESNGLTAWYGQGNLIYIPFKINQQGKDLGAYFEDYYAMSGYDIIDIENDNDPDIVTKIFNFGNPTKSKEIDLSKLIYINNLKNFDRFTSKDYVISNEKLGNQYPDYLRAIVKSGKLWFIGPSYKNDGAGPYRIMVEIETDIPASYWYESQ